MSTIHTGLSESIESFGITGGSDDLSWVHLHDWHYNYLKRTLDLLGALLGLSLLAIPGVLIVGLLWAMSGRPIFYREERIGRYGRLFTIWKLRTMRPERNSHGDRERVLAWRMHKDMVDPRITPLGRVLRTWSVDELPQLLNILKGDMSFIGPRPIVGGEVKEYGDLIDYYLAATPGLTGKWQVSGRSDVGYRERAELDAAYVKEWSLSADFAILLQTFPVVLSRAGAY